MLEAIHRFLRASPIRPNSDLRDDPGQPPRAVPEEHLLLPLVLRAVAAVGAEVAPIWERLVREGVQNPTRRTGFGSDSLVPFLDEFLQDGDERVRRMGEACGLRPLGYGKGRVAFALGEGLAVKVPMHDEGREAIEHERRLWSRAPHEHAMWLMPMLAADPSGNWCIMPLSEGSGVAHYDLPRDLEHSLVDPEGDYNWGVWCGRPVLLDYE